jgi:acyl-CoA thioesterase-1
MTPPSPCETPRELRALGQALPNFADALYRLGAVDIVTVGSSSTEGDGASSRDSSYPSRLNVALSSRFPDRTIKLINAGVGRQEAPDEAARFKNDVLGNNPSLVIWQVGTNAAWKDYFLEDVRDAMFRGLDRLRGCKADVILMDPHTRRPFSTKRSNQNQPPFRCFTISLPLRPHRMLVSSAALIS